jgi:hypothetical protein
MAEDGTNLKAEFQAEAARIAEAEAQADATYAANIEEEERLAEEWRRQR